MDENYLDRLLQGVKTEQDPEQLSAIDEAEDSFEDLSEMFDTPIDIDSSEIDSISELDMEDDLPQSLNEESISLPQEIDELDHLDELADLDMLDIDFDDIDFDDLDIFEQESPSSSSMKEIKSAVSETAEEAEDDFLSELSIDELYLDDTIPDDADHMEQTEKSDEEQKTEPEELSEDALDDMFTELENEVSESQQEAQTLEESGIESLEQQLDLMMSDTNDTESLDSVSDEAISEPNEPFSESLNNSTDDLEDLFSTLGLSDPEEEPSSQDVPPEIISNENAIIPDELADLLDMSSEESEISNEPQSRKRSFWEFLFGADDDEPTADELEAAQQKKLAKKQKKEEQKKEKEAKQQEQKAMKLQTQNEKKRAAAMKKSEKKAKEAAELAKLPPEKGLNKVAVIIVFVFFAICTILFLTATNIFNYNLVITKAANYFERQKYHQAYQQIVGVDVKEDDEELKSRIYTVMQVERLYESYENNIAVNRYDKALDALLRGLLSYDTYYDEANSLGVATDLNYCKNEVLTALQTTYHLTEADARAMAELTGTDYQNAIRTCAETVTPDSNTTEEE